MKKIISLLVLTTVTSAYGQIQATPAPPAAESQAIQATPAAAAPAATTTAAPAKAVSTSVTTAKKEKPKSPWSGSFLSEVSRNANINHSKLLDVDNPSKRTDASLFFALTVKYKSSAKNSFSLANYVARDIVTNPASDTDDDWSVKNARVGWTRATDITLLGSAPIAMPFSISLPTSYDSRKNGFIGGFRFTPTVSWELNPTWSISHMFRTDVNFQNPPGDVYKSDYLTEKATVLMTNSLTLSANLTDTVSISQSVGTASRSVNLKNPLGMEQTGAELDVSSGISWMALPTLSVDFSVGQAAPLQGNGYLATKVYDDNQYKLYHEAQTGYTLDLTYLF